MGKPKSVKLAQSKGISRKRSVGAYGSKRGTPDKQVHRAEVRFQQPRVRNSMAEVREEQARLEATIRAQQEAPELGPTEGALWAQRKAEEEARRAAEAARAEAEAAAREEERRREAAAELERRRHEGIGAVFEPWEGDPKPGWTTGQARQMLRQGYHVRKVMAMTGVGYRWLNDIRIDDDGFGIPDAS